jgi:hypothetical protein
MKDGGKPHVLFDLVADPLEMDNLIHKAEYADIAASLHKKMRARMIGTDDHYVLAPSYGCEGLNLWHKDQ